MKSNSKTTDESKKYLPMESTDEQMKLAAREADVSAMFASVLSQGTIPNTDDKGLLEGISRIGNFAFIQAVERKAQKNDKFKTYMANEFLDGYVV